MFKRNEDQGKLELFIKIVVKWSYRTSLHIGDSMRSNSYLMIGVGWWFGIVVNQLGDSQHAICNPKLAEIGSNYQILKTDQFELWYGCIYYSTLSESNV